MKRRCFQIGGWIGVVSTLGVLVLVSGIVPVGASGGHWPITRWILDFASDRSVHFHSRGIEIPALDEPGMVELGAATYHSNCLWCHGRPGQPTPPVAAAMTPSPPYLPDTVGTKEPRELYYIVKHGIKFAGMPAWPTEHRDDDVWPVVAFLRKLPTISEQAYQQHVSTEPAADSELTFLIAQACGACHGSQGIGRGSPRIPEIAGQSAEYMAASLRAFRDGRRHSGIMQPIAARLTDRQISALAKHYATQQASHRNTNSSAAHSEQIALGETIVMNGLAKAKIPSCVDCHDHRSTERNPAYPKLAGQSASYLQTQLSLFASSARGGTERANLMHPIANKLTDQQRAAVAAYYESFRAE